MTDDVRPSLDPGLTHLDSPDARSTALHRLVLDELGARDGPAYWLDARNVAAPHTLYELAPHHRVLDGLRVARAFTAYQHHTLARKLARTVPARASLLVVPNVASLYQDDDVPEYERAALYEATVTLLAELGETYDLPVLVTTDASGADLPAPARAIDCERTQLGLRFEAPDFETTVYVEDGYWQTTIPYWVALFGTTNPTTPTGVPTEPTAPTLPEAITGP